MTQAIDIRLGNEALNTSADLVLVELQQYVLKDFAIEQAHIPCDASCTL